MDHVVYVDTRQGDLEKLLSGSARMIVRGAMVRKLPYDRVQLGEVRPVTPFAIDRSEYSNMDDWLPVGDIERVIIVNRAAELD